MLLTWWSLKGTESLNGTSWLNDTDLRTALFLIPFLSLPTAEDSLNGKPGDCGCLEAVQRAKPLLHIWVSSQGQSAERWPAGGRPAPGRLCRRFHLGANTVLWLLFSECGCQTQTSGEEERKNWKEMNDTPRPSSHQRILICLLELCTWPNSNIKDKRGERSQLSILCVRRNICHDQFQPSWIIKVTLFESVMKFTPRAASWLFSLIFMSDELMRRYISSVRGRFQYCGLPPGGSPGAFLSLPFSRAAQSQINF